MITVMDMSMNITTMVVNCRFLMNQIVIAIVPVHLVRKFRRS